MDADEYICEESLTSKRVEIEQEGLELSTGLRRLLIIDFGSQLSHLICRRCREIGVYSELRSCTSALYEIRNFNPSGLILSGGPASVYEQDSPHLPEDVWNWIDENSVPVLGICYGMQEVVYAYEGLVEAGSTREFGKTQLKILNKTCPLFKGIETDSTQVWMSHGDKVIELPKKYDFQVVASSENCNHAVIVCEERKLYALQYHPEVTHTIKGQKMIANFAVDVCGCEPNWNMQDFIKNETQRIHRIVGSKSQVVAAISGGVDSTVATALCYKALGTRFHPFLVDNGLLRMREADEIKCRLKKSLPDLNLKVLQKQELFLKGLTGISNPEDKRKIIGQLFIESFEAEVLEMHLNPSDCFLLQGTLYPDVIESTSYRGPSSTIKTHHNVGGLPKRMKMKVLEPLRLLFKDEVRELGKALGLYEDSLLRHPFPGPGLAIRIIGPVEATTTEILRAADDIYIEELKSSGEYYKIGQAFCVLLPSVRTVGVMGDKRTYEMALAIRAVITSDFMTADWYPMPYELLSKISTRIINEVKGINRVVYDVSSKPPATIEWE